MKRLKGFGKSGEKFGEGNIAIHDIGEFGTMLM